MYPVELVGDRVLVRELRPQDADSILVYASDPEVHQFMIWQGSDRREDTIEWLNLADKTAHETPRTQFHLAIEVSENTQMVGGLSLLVNEQEQRGGIVLRRDAWGKGYATDAVRMVVRFAFETLRLHRIFAHVDVGNIASSRVLEKSGTTREGLMRQSERVGSEWRDTYLFAMLETDSR